MNAETFGVPFRHNRNRGGFRGRGAMGFRGGRGRGASRGSFGAPHAGGSGYRGGYRGGQEGREFSSFEYRVMYTFLLESKFNLLSYKTQKYSFCSLAVVAFLYLYTKSNRFAVFIMLLSICSKLKGQK